MSERLYDLMKQGARDDFEKKYRNRPEMEMAALVWMGEDLTQLIQLYGKSVVWLKEVGHEEQAASLKNSISALKRQYNKICDLTYELSELESKACPSGGLPS
ncbi:MAG: hypothetical protein ACF8OB_05015 [Phycisphaeraceae bacterium JB051]